MNYYEQFYDDLEFEDPYYHPDPYRRHDPYYDRDPYDDPYHRRDPYDDNYSHPRDIHTRERGIPRPHPYDVERRQFGHDRGRGNIPRGGGDRGHVPRGRGDNRGRGGDRGRGRGGDHGRGRDVDRGRGRGHSSGPPKGRGKTDNKTDDKKEAPQAAKGLFGMNFVKAGNSNETKGETKEDANSSTNDTIRFDYKSFQSQRSETEKEVEEALKAFSCHLGYGYGYGPRSDLSENAGEANWIEQEGCEVVQDLPAVTQSEEVHETPPKSEPANPVKKAVVNPAFNFVKAKSEFKSTDVAFHETDKEEAKPKLNHLSVNMGNKRIGLGFGASVAGNSGSLDISEKFYSGSKNGCNAQFDRKFSQLHQAVKARNNPNKNGIEVMHMAVDRIKMAISDDIRQSGRTPTGQAMFLCRLLIDGVYVAEGHATAKKAAKHEAYTNGVKLLMNDKLTVKEVSKGVFELKQKEPEFKVPSLPIGKQAASTNKGQGQFGSGTQVAQNPVMSKEQQLAALSKSEPAAKKPPPAVTCSKPKIVFHKASHPLSDKPLDFKTPTQPPQSAADFNNSSTTEEVPASQGPDQSVTQHPVKSPAELAMKLLNFVKEGESETQNQATNTLSLSSSQKTPGNQISGSGPQTYGGTVNFHQGSPNAYSTPGPSTSSPHTYSSYRGGKLRSTVSIVNSSPRKRPLESAGGCHSKLKVQKVSKGANVLEDMSQFIIIDHSVLCDQQSVNEISVLRNSANFNRVVLKVEYEHCEAGVNCSLIISDEVVATAYGDTKDTAKANAAREALVELQNMCYTIRIKQQVDNDASGLTKEQLMSDIQKSGEMLPDSNIGNMLLRKMGWVGGGMGKEGQGIAEPIKTEQVIGREGLGLQVSKHMSKDFRKNVTKLLEDYIKSNDQKDLHFSSELLKEERALIHTIGQKMGLKTNSKGKGDNRYLIVSRKRSARELLDHVIESGGVTSKYEVIPPRCEFMDFRKMEDVSFGHNKQ